MNFLSIVLFALGFIGTTLFLDWIEAKWNIGVPVAILIVVSGLAVLLVAA